MVDEKKKAEKKKPVDTEDSEVKTTALGGLIEFFQANLGDTIAYIVLAIGLILCFFHPMIGGLLVGFIMGLYFSKKVSTYAAEFREFLISEGIFRGFIIIASLVAFAISAPGISIGIFLGALTRPLFGDHIHYDEDVK